jgi:hypothetical protein
MNRHFNVSVAKEDTGFSVEVSEKFAMTRGRTTLAQRDSATRSPEEIGDVVREIVVEMLQPPVEPETRASDR